MNLASRVRLTIGYILITIAFITIVKKLSAPTLDIKSIPEQTLNNHK